MSDEIIYYIGNNLLLSKAIFITMYGLIVSLVIVICMVLEIGTHGYHGDDFDGNGTAIIISWFWPITVIPIIIIGIYKKSRKYNEQ